MTHQANDGGDLPLTLTLHKQILSQLVELTVTRTLQEIDWPQGRIALTEEEAASCCGVGRHVLRDLRQRELLPHRRVGKKIVYRRQDLIDLLRDQRFDSRRPQS
jgi:hypothetical protein